MANSRCPGPQSFGPFSLHVSASTPGSRGVNDAGDPDAFTLIGDSGGPLGMDDCADPNLPLSSINAERFRLSLRYFSSWELDPDNLLDDSSLNPEFVDAARSALWDASKAGLQPRIHEVYRSAEESDRKHKLYLQKKGHKAAAAWHSCHNFGLAMDVWMYEAGQYVDDKYAGRGKTLFRRRFGFYKDFSDIAKRHQLVWGHSFDDDDHFEYHPNWQNVNGTNLMAARKWALKAAAEAKDSESDTWLQYFWWAAGAGGQSPADEVLAKVKPPKF